MAEISDLDRLFNKIFTRWDYFATQEYDKHMCLLTNFAHGIAEVTKEGWVVVEPQEFTNYEVACVPASRPDIAIKRACYCGVNNSIILQQKFPVEPGLKPFPENKIKKDEYSEYFNSPPYAYLVVSLNKYLDEPYNEDEVLSHQQAIHTMIKGLNFYDHPDYDENSSQTVKATERARWNSMLTEKKPELYNPHIFDILGAEIENTQVQSV